MEWSTSNKLNPFNSYKGLTWYESHYKPISKWWDGEGALPPPIEVSFDCCHDCNFKCFCCNSQKHTNKGKGRMGRDKMRETLELLARMGVRGICFGGGGEPLMNRDLWHFPEELAELGLESAVATNGSLFTKKTVEEFMCCTWVAVSVDASTDETFHKVHGVNKLQQVLSNIRLLVEAKKRTCSKVLISYRFLITPANWFEVNSACRVARSLGVDVFHARPADLERKDFKGIVADYDILEINNRLTECHLLETDTFKVITATHKFNNQFKVFHSFKNCVASPLVLQVCADGNSYVCPDHKLEDRFKLCETKDILVYWGSVKHRDLLKGINVKEECSRCTWTPYQEQIEKLAMGDDPMHLSFP